MVRYAARGGTISQENKPPDDPITFPVPAFYFFIRNVETSGRKTANKMKITPSITCMYLIFV
jgi:hypothetical protein